MKAFMDDDFLLKNKTSVQLYHEYAKQMPIIDYHCHVSPREISEDLQYENIAQVWLSGDHYKWKLIRSNGIPERLITGNEASDWEKFLQFAKTLPLAIGNPLYHWTHLELKRYFDCDLQLNPENANEIWDLCNQKLRSGFGVRQMIQQSNVEVICTTDDPADSLEWHMSIAEDKGFDVSVLPAFRPDKAMNLESEVFLDYLKKLSASSEIEIKSFEDLLEALDKRIEFFDKMGCKVSDHALEYCFCSRNKDEAILAFEKGLRGETLTLSEIESYKTELLLFFAERFNKLGWTMQIHYGALRNINTKMMKKLGPDTGFDAISSRDSSKGLAELLDAIEQNSGLPKMILYSLNPNDNAMIMSIIGCFQGTETHGKLQHGSAWWFNDTKTGMKDQIRNLASGGILGNFIGMLTDSRSFLSYTRHEYFRRILCNLLGKLVEDGEYPNDMTYLGDLVQDICYRNAKRYFAFD